MKRLRANISAIIASAIITALVISGMLAIGADAMRAANSTRASHSNPAVAMKTNAATALSTQ